MKFPVEVLYNLATKKESDIFEIPDISLSSYSNCLVLLVDRNIDLDLCNKLLILSERKKSKAARPDAESRGKVFIP